MAEPLKITVTITEQDLIDIIKKHGVDNVVDGLGPFVANMMKNHPIFETFLFAHFPDAKKKSVNNFSQHLRF
jgi:hypothetical protein